MTGADSPLTPEDVQSLYRGFLGRDPSTHEVEQQMAACGTARELLHLVRASDEYAARLLAAPETTVPVVETPHVNIWHPQLAALSHPPGTESADGVAVMGHEGWLFVKSGTNATLAQHRGEDPPSAAWLDGWMEALAVRRREAAQLDVTLACIVVPDKLAIYEEHFPEPIEPVGPRPALRLLQRAGDELLYPLQELRAARADGNVALRTDTHLTVHGNHVLAAAVMRPLSLPVPDRERLGPLREYP